MKSSNVYLLLIHQQNFIWHIYFKKITQITVLRKRNGDKLREIFNILYFLE